MSEVLDSIINNTTLNGDYSFIDADTVRDSDGNKYRIQGMDAPEISKIIDGQVTASTAGGYEVTSSIQKLAREQGFTNVVLLDQKDPFGRQMVDLQDSKGNSFTNRVISSGALESNAYTQAQDTLDAEIHALFGDQVESSNDEFKEAAASIQQAIQAESRENKLFREAAINELDYLRSGGSSLSGMASANLEFDDPDVDLNANALNPLSESFETGLLSMKESAFGVASLIGEATGIDSLKEFGEAGSARARGRIAEQAGVLVDYKDVNGFSDALEFLGNNLAMSLPYMGMAIAGTIVNPVVGLSSMSAVYSGQTWNEMEGDNKNTALALGSGILQATIDRLSLGMLIKGGSKLNVKNQYNDIVEAYAKQNDVGREAAEAAVANATRLEIANLSKDAAALAKEQLDKRAVAMDFLKRMGAGAVTEGSTEALQETIGYVSAHTADGFDFGELQERIIGAVAAGGGLGGTFGMAGAAANTGAWADVAYGVSREDPKDVAFETDMAREEEQAAIDAKKKELLDQYPDIDPQTLEVKAREQAQVKTIDDITEDVRTEAAVRTPFESFESMAEREAERRKKRTVGETASELAGQVPALYRGQVAQTFSQDVLRKSKTARQMRDMFGGGLQRIYAGSDFENYKHHMLTTFKNKFNKKPEKVFMELNDGKALRGDDRERLSKILYDMVNADGSLNQAKIDAHPKAKQLNQLVKDLEVLANDMHARQVKYNPKLGKLDNYLLKYKALNKLAVVKQRSKFIKILKSEYNLTDADATKITDNIINNDYDLDEAFTVVKGGATPQSHKKRTLGLSTKRDKEGNLAFDEFFEKDLFTNVSSAAKSAARYIATQKYIGEDGSVVSTMLQRMRKEGLSQEEVDHIAFRMKNYIDSESGNYKRPTSEFGKTLEKVQKNFMLVTMVAGLPLSTISSFVEVALGSRGLTRDQIFGAKGREGGLSKIGREFASMLNSGMTEITNASRISNKEQMYETLGRQYLKKLGFYEWDVGAASTTGVLETHSYHQKLVEGYFKWNGLQGWTNFNRATRASMFGDFLLDNLEIVINGSTDPKDKTNRQREAEEKLRNLGLDVSPQGAIDMFNFFDESKRDLFKEDKNKFDRLDGLLREAQYSFITEAVAQPKAANRPLYYQDPRFALVNQFQGFMSTFTANHIPRLWNEYIKRGSPAMKYQTFAMMTTMIMLGFASQYLKDQLKYGGNTPYLDEAEYIRRGILSSGLAGTSERIIEQLFPIYETRSDGVGEWAWNTVSGESPSLTNLVKLGQAAGHAVKGEMSEAAWDVSKATLGPLTNVGETVYKKLKDDNTWNY